MKFNANAPFWQFMNTLARFTALNLVYLVTLIPIITIVGNGMGMMLFQGSAAFELWTGEPMPIEHMKEVLNIKYD